MPEENENEITPIDIPVEVPQDGNFADMEGAEQDALMDALFSEDVPDADVQALRDNIAAEILALEQEVKNPENRAAALETVGRMENLVRYMDIAEGELGRRQAAADEIAERASAVSSRVAAPEAVEAAEGDEGEGGRRSRGRGRGGSRRRRRNGRGRRRRGRGRRADPDDGGPPPAAEAAQKPKPKGAALTQKLANNAKARKGGGRAPAGTAVLADARPDADSVEALALELLGSSDPGRSGGPLRTARSNFANLEEGTSVDTLAMIGKIFYGKYQEGKGRYPKGLHDDRVSLTQSTVDFSDERKLSDDARENFGIFRSLRSDVETIVASGGSCAPAAPRYDIFRLAEPQSPVEDNLPVLGAPRGSIRFVVPPDFRDMRSGIGVTTDAEDAAGYGSGSGQASPKPCVHVDCADIDECVVDTVSQCIEFGNLTFETFPEFVAARVADLAVNFASVKEIFYLDKIDAASILQTFAATYGVARAVHRHVATSSHNYRKRNNMDVDATLDWYAPDWLAVACKVDIVNDNSWGTQNFGVTMNDITGYFASLSLNVVWYYDSATGEGQAFTTAAEDGTGNPFPQSATWYLHAPGTFVHLDAGTLDLGIVRDSVLNATNDLQIFAEQWIQVCQLGIEGIKGRSTNLCPSGAAPTGVTVLNCAA